MTRKTESKKTKRARARFWLIGLAVSVSLVAGILISDRADASSNSLASRANAASSQSPKIADDLSEKVEHSKGSDRLAVIIQSVGKWSDAMDTVTAVSGGSISRSYANFEN